MCRDHSDFRPVLASFPENPSLDDMIDAIIDFSQKHRLFPELLAVIEDSYPRQFERHYPEIFNDGQLQQEAEQAPHAPEQHRGSEPPGGIPGLSETTDRTRTTETSIVHTPVSVPDDGGDWGVSVTMTYTEH